MRILITGGAGFIGSNLAAKGITLGHEVTVIDNLSRPGSRWNRDWLHSVGPYEFIHADVTECTTVERLFQEKRFDAIFHEAAQVAVITSVRNPRSDFEQNALGTLNVLEAVRLSGQEPVIIFASTNKVYGPLSSLTVIKANGRYALRDLPEGVPATAPLDFYSPYGCSKGAADQYVLDYSRIYGLKTIVFRQSCIYGPRQLGFEDQGWIAWFVICAVLGRPITIYGDGRQTRDVLYIDDLVDLYFAALRKRPECWGVAFNVGGGCQHVLSVLEAVRLLERNLGSHIHLVSGDWRPGDQRVYISDIRAAREAFEWSPKVLPEQGIESLLDWVKKEETVLRSVTRLGAD